MTFFNHGFWSTETKSHNSFHLLTTKPDYQILSSRQVSTLIVLKHNLKLSAYMYVFTIDFRYIFTEEPRGHKKAQGISPLSPSIHERLLDLTSLPSADGVFP